MTYDPQRRHARQPVAASDHAPVDALLGEADEPTGPTSGTDPRQGAAPEAPMAVPTTPPGRSDASPMRLVAAVAAAFAAFFLLWLLLRRRRR